MLLGAVLALAGCAADDGPVCPASAELVSPNVLVDLAGWPTAASVVLQCSPTCAIGLDGPPPAELTSSVDGGTAGFDVTADPDAVVVVVLDRVDRQLTALETELDWVRVGGTVECGGPLQATVTVPAP